MDLKKGLMVPMVLSRNRDLSSHTPLPSHLSALKGMSQLRASLELAFSEYKISFHSLEKQFFCSSENPGSLVFDLSMQLKACDLPV